MRKTFYRKGVIHFMDLSVYHCGYEKSRLVQMEEAEGSRHYLFYYIVSGDGSLRVQNETEGEKIYSLSSGRGFLVDAERKERYQLLAKGNWEYAWIEFGGVLAGKYMNRAGLSDIQPLYIPEEAEQSEEILSCMLSLIRCREEYPLRAVGHMYLLLDSLIRTSHFRRKKDMNLKCERYVNRAVNYIEQNYFRPISVEELAKRCWLDRSYFGKVFKSVTGQSPQSFLISFRMEKAAEELMMRDTPIGDVGAAVGYPNQLNFSRAFKGVYGISPREYRQRNMITDR